MYIDISFFLDDFVMLSGVFNHESFCDKLVFLYVLNLCIIMQTARASITLTVI